MPRTCTICNHPDRERIDQALVEGGAYRVIAKQYGVSAPATFRHKLNHLPKAMVRAHEAKQAASADNLLANVCSLQKRANRILRKAEKSEDHRIALSAIRELRNTVELLARLAGELQEGTTVNVLVSPEYQALRSKVIDALAPFPEARVAVAEALRE